MNKKEVEKLIKDADAYCREQGLRFTEPRRYVLEIIASSAKPLGAYAILEKLGSYIESPKPPTAYRAIEFLSGNGFIHRIESLNAYVVCGTDHRHTGSQFLICGSCGKVVEAHLCHVPEGLAKQAEIAGFRLTRWNAELHGLCDACS
ncbi:MAG: Fur family transcriptional regulator [Micavibrio sp.]